MQKLNAAAVWLAHAALYIAWRVRLALINSNIKAVRKTIADLERLERNLPAAMVGEVNKQAEGIDQQREAEQALRYLRQCLAINKTEGSAQS